MIEHIVTFLYDGITDPEGERELSGTHAYNQFVSEFECANVLPPSVLGWRFVGVTLDDALVHVRFVTREGVDDANLCELIQTYLYDEGGLTGEFVMGRVVPFEVSRQEMVVKTRKVYAVSEEEAVKKASAGGAVLSCKAV